MAGQGQRHMSRHLRERCPAHAPAGSSVRPCGTAASVLSRSSTPIRAWPWRLAPGRRASWSPKPASQNPRPSFSKRIASLSRTRMPVARQGLTGDGRAGATCLCRTILPTNRDCRGWAKVPSGALRRPSSGAHSAASTSARDEVLPGDVVAEEHRQVAAERIGGLDDAGDAGGTHPRLAGMDVGQAPRCGASARRASGPSA